MLEILILSALVIAGDPTVPQPTSTPAKSTPEIGRVKALLPACVALREVVAPSFAAALSADKRFSDASVYLADYAAKRVEATTLPTKIRTKGGAELATRLQPADPKTVTPESLLARLDIEFSQMSQNVLTMGKELGDPRVGENVTDPGVQAERRELERLYETQLSRLSALHLFLEKERKRLSDQREAEGAAAAGLGASANANVAQPVASPDAEPTAAPIFGQPSLNGIALNDRRSVQDWTAGIVAQVRTNENIAAHTFLGITDDCR
jgi:hypothetical protein